MNIIKRTISIKNDKYIYAMKPRNWTEEQWVIQKEFQNLYLDIKNAIIEFGSKNPEIIEPFLK